MRIKIISLSINAAHIWLIQFCDFNWFIVHSTRSDTKKKRNEMTRRLRRRRRRRRGGKGALIQLLLMDNQSGDLNCIKLFTMRMREHRPPNSACVRHVYSTNMRPYKKRMKWIIMHSSYKLQVEHMPPIQTRTNTNSWNTSTMAKETIFTRVRITH